MEAMEKIYSMASSSSLRLVYEQADKAMGMIYCRTQVKRFLFANSSNSFILRGFEK